MELRFPLKLSEGLTVSKDKTTGALNVVDADGKTTFFAPTPTMWDAKIDEASGLPAAEIDVETELLTEGNTPILVLKASKEWLQAPEREYPVTIDPTWSGGASDTFVQNDNPDRTNAGWEELRVGTFNSGATQARSYIQFDPGTTLTGKKITKAEVRLNNYYSYSCYASEIRLQRVTAAWTASTATWNNQPAATSTGQGSNTQSKGYNSTCAGGYVYFPATPIVQYWADNPSLNHGVKLMPTDTSSNYSWKRYRSANYILGENNAAEPQLIVTYNSYPNTPSAVTFGTGESVKDAAGKLWVRKTKPQFRATVSDPDGLMVKAEFDMTGTSVLKQFGSTVASKSVSTLTPTLAENGTYTVKARASDGVLLSKSAGTATTFTVDSVAPTTPSIASSAGYTDGAWKDVKPSTNTFTFTSSADTNIFQYQTNNDAWRNLTATSGKATLSWNPTGSNVLRVKAIDKATNTSATKTFTFGNGAASLTAPGAGMTTSDAFKVTATGPVSSTGTVTPTVYWREANTVAADTTQYGATTGWHTGQTLAAIAQGQPVSVNTMLDVSASPAGVLAGLGKDRIPALVEIQVCFDYAGAPATSKLQCTTNKAKKAIQVTKLPHAFGDNYPVAEAGDGQVALATGELNLSETDVTVDAGNTGLSLSRSHSSYSGIGANSKIFGNGWRANIGGPDEGLADLMVAESTALDGTISLISDDETAAVFRQPGNGRVAFKTGVYAPANEEATASGWKVELTGTGTAMRIKITEEDGTATTFKKGAILAENQKVWEWIPDTISGGNAAGTSTFVSDAAGRTTKVIAGTETTLSCTTTTPAPGCRILNLAYDAAGKLTTVTYTAWDQAKGAMDTVPIAAYGYDGTGVDAKLLTVKDSRTGDTTTYTYGANSAAGVSLITSSVEKASSGKLVDAPTYYEYGLGNNTSGRADWLEVVKRGNPSTGADKIQVARFVYGVPAAGNGDILPDLSESAVKLWDQEQVPVTGYAVFGPGKAIGTSKSGGVGAADWKYADLQYVDSQNRVVNTASYAAGKWQNTADVFNNEGNITRGYDMRAIRNIRDEAGADASTVTNGVFNAHEDYASHNIYFSDLSAYVDENGDGISAQTDPVLKLAEQQKNEATAEFLRGYVTDTYTPVTTDEDGSPARVHTRTTYTSRTDLDVGGMPRMLVTNTKTTQANAGAIDSDAVEPKVISETTNGYNAFEPDGDLRPTTSKDNKRSGWVVGSPTRVTTLMFAGAGNDISVTTWFDDQGRVKETRQPKSAGADAGATKTVYYTAAANADDAACGNSPVFAGYLCKATPQGTGSVKKHQTGFNIYGQSATFTESATGTPAATRTTTQTYRPDGQELKTTIAATGLTGSTAVPAIEKLYDANTGIQNGIRATGKPDVKWTQDLWGRTTSYTNSLGETTTTEYDGFGNVTKTNTPASGSTTTYKYGALSGDGTTEYQGVVTSMTVSNHGAAGQVGLYKATYDLDGNILTQESPGGITQVNDYDPGTGKHTGLTYTGPVKDQAGATTTAPWITWGITRDATGRIVGENTPDGDLLTGTGTTGDRAAAYDKNYTYDHAGRLTEVTDLTAAAGENINTDPAEGPLTPVTVRKYAFDKNGNRTSLTTTVNGTQTAQKTWAFDAADRVTAGYVYDGLGRQTSVPAADAPRTGATAAGTGAITLGYYDDDTARTITRGSITTTIGLDAAGRRLTLASNGEPGTETKHYTDDSDNPGWTTRTQGTTTTTTRYESTIGGDLALTITAQQVELAVNNPHGDTVTTIPLTGTDAGQGIKGWAQYDEYGNQTTDPVNTGATTYGWHGADQRALDASGLILMGARLYNSVAGLFTSRDPVEGGNSTTYAYPQDPVGMNDISGQWGWAKAAWKSTKRFAGRVGRFTVKHWRNGNIGRVVGAAAFGACLVASAGLCGAASVAAAGVSIAKRISVDYGQNRRSGMSKSRAAGHVIRGSLLDIGFSRLPTLRGAKGLRGRHRAGAYAPRTARRWTMPKSKWKKRAVVGAYASGLWWTLH